MTRIPVPAYVGSNTQYLNLPFFHFLLRGQGNSKEIVFNPPFIRVEESLNINTFYEFSTKVIKSSEGEAQFTLSLDGKSSELFEIELHTPSGLICNGTEEIHQEIKNEQIELELKLRLHSSEIGS